MSIKSASDPKEDVAGLTSLEKTVSTSLGITEDNPLSHLGLEPEVRKDLNLLGIIATGWNICNSWVAVAATMSISIASGGPMTMIYGIVIIFLLGGSCALSMAEIASTYPTAGGQYHWTSILSPPSLSRGLSYWCGLVNTFGWIASIAGFIVPFPTITLALVSFWNPGYVAEAWHTFVIYQALNILLTVYNIFGLKKTFWIMDVGFFMSIIAFFVMAITCLVESNPKQSSESIWTHFENTSGWSSDAVVFLIGLVNPNFIYSGLDGVIHLSEECSNAATAIPRALASTVLIGFVTSLGFAIALCYSYHNFDDVLASAFPALEIFYQATASARVATFFTIVLAIISLFAITGAQQTASRLTWSFARDEALAMSSHLSQVHPRWGVPIYALLFNAVCVAALGCIYLGSSDAFNSLVSAGLILQQLSFAFPAALMLYHRISGTVQEIMPLNKEAFRLPFGTGALANGLTIVLALISTIFYNFPAGLPATADAMNYASAVTGALVLIGIVNWYGYAVKHYNGPRLDSHHSATVDEST
ncbi:amino acid/polyamine transporter I [Coniella lustricola]|uniref:Amino acid/polyamine transporter I n=1 Tax=Coniella lustricola TaxID=2025994 RepID=A0A2T3A706_9PEZI|nr:amino acid/polyamine transporter I [Coniella lustricola]